jgi:L-idonate 5-dehydrogenase
MQSRIVRLHGKRDIRIETEDAPSPGPGELLLQMAMGGICGSDLHYYQDGGFGPIQVREPIISGHEASGFVAALGDGVTFPPVGALVAVNPSQPCGTCAYCTAGQPIHCLDMRFMGSAMRLPHEQGMFRNVLVVPARQCFPVAEGISPAEAACAEPLAVCLHAVAQAGNLTGMKVLVTGAAEIVATDLTDAALARAPAMGATSVINVAQDAQALARYEAGKGYFDIVFDCSAATPALRSAFATVRPRGTIIQVGVTGDITIPLNALVGKEITWRGSQRFDREFEQAGDRTAACKVQIKLGELASSPGADA